MDNKVIPFNQKNRKSTNKEEVVQVLSLGCIHLDLSISLDGISVYCTPSYELEDGISDELCDTLNDMLKKRFPEEINNLFDIYKSDK